MSKSPFKDKNSQDGKMSVRKKKAKKSAAHYN